MSETKKTDLDLFVIEQVRKRRNELKISQAVLAIKLNVSDAFIGAVENPNQRAKYNISHLNEIAKALNCSPKDFLPESAI